MIKKFFALCTLLLLPVVMIEASQHADFDLKNFKGRYIGRAFTAGGSQPTSTASIFRLRLKDNGTGNITYYTSRTYGTSTVTITTDIPVVLAITNQGTGTLTVQNFPAGFNTIISLVAKKKNGIVTKGFGLRDSIVSQSGGALPGPIQVLADEIITYEIVRQITPK